MPHRFLSSFLLTDEEGCRPQPHSCLTSQSSCCFFGNHRSLAVAPQSSQPAGPVLVTLGPQPGARTPSVADIRLCYKVPSYCKVSNGLKSGGSCESGNISETHHALKKKTKPPKERKKEKEEQHFTNAAILQAEGRRPQKLQA